MKIAIVTRGVSATKGGAERFTSSFCQEMVASGHEILLLSAEDSKTVEKGVEFFSVKTLKIISFLKLFFFHLKVNHILKKKKCDIVYGLCQFYPLNVFYAGGGVHKHWMKIRYPNYFIRILKYIFSPAHLVMVFLENKIFSKDNSNKVIITNSNLVKRHILENYSIEEQNIKVIYDGVDHDLFNSGVKVKRVSLRKELKIDMDSIIIMHASNNWERKGVKTILQAMQSLPDNYNLLLVGRGKKQKIMRQLKKYGINSQRVIFAGIVKNIEQYYGISDFFVLPTMYDPFAQVCREALACGLPVITTKENGAAEVITNHLNGYVLERWDDYQTLATVLKDYTSPEKIEKMNINATESVKQFSWQSNFINHQKIFLELKKLG